MAKEKVNDKELKEINGGVDDDHAFYRYVMLDSVKYKCNSCEYTWSVEQNITPSCCPECGRTDISKQ